MICYLTHAWKPSKPVDWLKDAEPGWSVIFDAQLGKQYVVPNDQLEWKDLDVGDLL